MEHELMLQHSIFVNVSMASVHWVRGVQTKMTSNSISTGDTAQEIRLCVLHCTLPSATGTGRQLGYYYLLVLIPKHVETIIRMKSRQSCIPRLVAMIP